MNLWGLVSGGDLSQPVCVHSIFLPEPSQRWSMWTPMPSEQDQFTDLQGTLVSISLLCLHLPLSPCLHSDKEAEGYSLRRKVSLPDFSPKGFNTKMNSPQSAIRSLVYKTKGQKLVVAKLLLLSRWSVAQTQSAECGAARPPFILCVSICALLLSLNLP